MNKSLLIWLIGVRFLLAKKTTRFLSLVTRVSVFGLTLGVIALVVVVSVMNGFDSQLKYRILGAVPHVVVSEVPKDNKSIIKATAKFLSYQGMVIGSDSRMMTIYGIDPENEHLVSVLPSHMQQGSIEFLVAGTNKAILGSALAARLGVWPGDKATILIPVASNQGGSVVPRIGKVEIAGSFKLESELDYGLIIMNVDDLKRLAGADAVNYRISLHDIFSVNEFLDADAAIKTESASSGVQQPGDSAVHSTVIFTWMDEFGDFFATVRMEKLMMFLLLVLIVMIAAFNTVSGLSMMVKEKQGEIAVLRTMGFSTRNITGIFVVQGAVIGLGGVILGLLIGIPIAYHVTEIVGFVEDMMGGRMLAGTYFDRVPTDVRWLDIAVIAIVSMVIALLATILPAYRAAKVQPAQVLRAE